MKQLYKIKNNDKKLKVINLQEKEEDQENKIEKIIFKQMKIINNNLIIIKVFKKNKKYNN